MNFETLWEVTHRPLKFEDIILTPEVREYFLNVQKTKNIPNILLVGEPGGGKCLDYDEEIEIFVDEEFYENFKDLL